MPRAPRRTCWSRIHALALAALAVGGTACAPAAPAEQPLGGTTGEARSATPPEPVAEREQDDLSGIVALPNFARDWPRLAPVVPAEGDARALRSLDVEALGALLLGRGLASVVDWSRPLYFIVFESHDDEPVVAISMAVADPERVLAELAPVFDVTKDGASLRHSLRYRDMADAKAPLAAEVPHCDFWESLGAHGALVVCAPNANRLRHAATAMRQQPPASETSEHQVELYLTQAAWRRFAEETLRDAAASSTDGMESEVERRLFLDVHSVSLGGRLSGKDVTLTVSLHYRPAKEPWSRMLLEYREGAPAPKAFLALPDNVGLAFSTRGAPRGAFDDVAPQLLTDLLAPSLAVDWDPTGTEEFIETLSELLLTGGPYLFAAGLDAEGARRAIDEYLADASDDPVKRRTLDAALTPFFVLATPEPVQLWVDGLRTLVAVDEKYTRVRLPDGFSRQRSGPPTRGVAPPRPPTVVASPKTQHVYFYREVKPEPIAGLGRPALHMVCDFVANEAFELDEPDTLPPVNGVLHIFVAKAHEHTYLCMGNDVDCTEALGKVGKAGTGTLGRLPVATELRKLDGSFVGLTTPIGAAALFGEFDTRAQLEEYRQALHDARRLPQRGERPILLHGGTTGSGAPPQGTFSVNMTMTTEDFVELGKSLFE
jgi:hypothetical protein